MEGSLDLYFSNMNISPYIRLCRLDKPVGIWLLFWPCAVGMGLASQGMPDLWQLLLFSLGAVLMRSAGCVINDIWDRDYDKQVERTRNRPLASGELNTKQAIALLLVLLALSLIVALLLPFIVLKICLFSLPLVVIYPLMKRFTYFPQVFLGITFNFGVLAGWACITGQVGLPAIIAYAALVFWTLGYDTIYAYQDKDDDVKAGIKSTALKFASNSRQILSVFYTVFILLMTLAGCYSEQGDFYYIILLIASLQLAWQVITVDINNADDCLRKFKSNAWLGFVLFVSTIF